MDFKCTDDLIPYASSTGAGFGDYLLLYFPPGFTLSN